MQSQKSTRILTAQPSAQRRFETAVLGQNKTLAAHNKNRGLQTPSERVAKQLPRILTCMWTLLVSGVLALTALLLKKFVGLPGENLVEWANVVASDAYTIAQYGYILAYVLPVCGFWALYAYLMNLEQVDEEIRSSDTRLTVQSGNHSIARGGSPDPTTRRKSRFSQVGGSLDLAIQAERLSRCPI